jgi:hypothetical protein
MSSQNSVGKECLAFCTACKMDLNHVIVALKGDQVKKVECKTCKKEHLYKAPKGATEPGKVKAKRATKSANDESKSQVAVAVEWEKLMNAHKNVSARSYGVKTSYTLGDKIKHTTFGEGIVTRTIYPNKIEVIFQNDLKVLIHGGTPSLV